jgi:hypothetical protein
MTHKMACQGLIRILLSRILIKKLCASVGSVRDFFQYQAYKNMTICTHGPVVPATIDSADNLLADSIFFHSRADISRAFADKGVDLGALFA